MALPVTLGGLDYVDRITEIMTGAFADDALNRYFITSLDGLPTDAQYPPQRRADFIRELIVQPAAELGAELSEAGNWAGVAIWYPPGITEPSPGPGEALPGVLNEWESKIAHAKSRHLGGRDFWLLNVMGRAPGRTDRDGLIGKHLYVGVARALIEPYLQRAREQRVPAWLEATNAHARDVYAHFGFRLVEEIRVGNGKVNANGGAEEGGDGITVYVMIVDV